MDTCKSDAPASIVPGSVRVLEEVEHDFDDPLYVKKRMRIDFGYESLEGIGIATAKLLIVEDGIYIVYAECEINDKSGMLDEHLLDCMQEELESAAVSLFDIYYSKGHERGRMSIEKVIAEIFEKCKEDA